MLNIKELIAALLLLISILLTYKYRNIQNKSMNQFIAISNCMMTTVFSYGLSKWVVNRSMIIVLVLAFFIILNVFVLIKMVKFQYPHKKMDFSSKLIALISTIVILLPLRNGNCFLFQEEWKLMMVSIFMYAVSAISEEIAFRVSYSKLFIKPELLDNFFKKGPSLKDLLGLLAICLLFAVLHFDFSWQEIYTRMFFALASFLILISTRSIALIILIHFISNVFV